MLPWGSECIASKFRGVAETYQAYVGVSICEYDRGQLDHSVDLRQRSIVSQDATILIILLFASIRPRSLFLISLPKPHVCALGEFMRCHESDTAFIYSYYRFVCYY